MWRSMPFFPVWWVPLCDSSPRAVSHSLAETDKAARRQNRDGESRAPANQVTSVCIPGTGGSDSDRSRTIVAGSGAKQGARGQRHTFVCLAVFLLSNLGKASISPERRISPGGIASVVRIRTRGQAKWPSVSTPVPVHRRDDAGSDPAPRTSVPLQPPRIPSSLMSEV